MCIDSKRETNSIKVMKANGAPEKLWIDPANDLPKLSGHINKDNIEYIRTDAFIEMALKWYCLDCECNDNCKDTKCFFYREFERYLKGGTNALPPKFLGRILNEDGSTSDNWCYRHFTAKMQDAFIEKACEYLMEYEFNDSPTIVDRMKRVETFKIYMRGE